MMTDAATRNISEAVTGEDACKIDDDRESLVYEIRFQHEAVVNAIKD
jgi:hypothetical protein